MPREGQHGGISVLATNRNFREADLTDQSRVTRLYSLAFDKAPAGDFRPAHASRQPRPVKIPDTFIGSKLAVFAVGYLEFVAAAVAPSGSPLYYHLYYNHPPLGRRRCALYRK